MGDMETHSHPCGQHSSWQIYICETFISDGAEPGLSWQRMCAPAPPRNYMAVTLDDFAGSGKRKVQGHMSLRTAVKKFICCITAGISSLGWHTAPRCSIAGA